MLFNKSFNFKAILILFVTFFILSYFVTGLNIYLDDVSYIFPSLIGNYVTHFSNYLRDNGFNRPFALFYYYFVFKLYSFNSQFAHLIPLFGYFFGGFILLRILILQGLKKNLAFLTVFLVLSVPFGAEIYSWFSASIGIWALLIFYLEIFLIEKFGFSGMNLLLIILLQSLVAFFYETTIFMALPLSFLSSITYPNSEIKFKIFFRNFLIIFSPVLLYLLIKISVPHVIASEFEVSKLSEIIGYFNNYLAQFYELFLTKGLKLFWVGNFKSGLSSLFISPIIALSFIILIYLIYSLSVHKETAEKIIIKKSRILFWLIALIGSLLPLIWKKYYLPFRTLYLPVSIFIVITALVFSNYYSRQRSLLSIILKRFSTQIKLIIVFISIYFLLIQIAMLKNYLNQYRHDYKIIGEIRKITQELGFNSENRTNLLLLQIPHNTLDQYIYGDFIFSMFNRSWTASGFIDLNSGTIKQIAVENSDNNFFSAKIDKNTFLKMRPLTVLKFNGIENCYIKRCFQIVLNEY